MTEGASRTLVCSVVFLDIVEYASKPVAVQLQVKQRCNGLLAAALEPVAPRDRIVLDTGEGAAIAFLGDPEDALLVALALRGTVQHEADANLSVRLGVNLGPVRLVRDLNGQANMIGDGINVAQRVMAFAEPGQLLVSRSFFEVVSRLSNDYAGLFGFAGARTDKHVREHEVYSVGSSAAAVRRLAATASRPETPETGPAGWRAALAKPGPLGVQRRALVAAPLVFAMLAGAGVALRVTMQPAGSPPDSLVQQAAPAPPARASASQPAPSVRPPDAESKAAEPQRPRQQASAPVQGRSRPAAASSIAHPAASAAASASIALAIAPWGEVLVDGKVRGVSPPMRSLELPPGRHTIEIRNTTFPSHVEQLDLKPGEKVRVRYLFQ